MLPADVASVVAELAACASLEITAGRFDEARAIADALPVGTRVYVNHLPRSPLGISLPTLKVLADAGLEAIPHVAARRVASQEEIDDFLGRASREAGVRKLLVLGGDLPTPVGPFVDAAALLRKADPVRHGIVEVGFAGYPEGHPRIAMAAMEAALADKIALARDMGLAPYVVTQFSFAPARVVAYRDRLSRACPRLPVYAGMAGPTEAAALLRFAQRCGVSASLRALKDMGMNAVRVVTRTDPREQLTALARYHAAQAASNLAGIHLFTFGGAAKSAQWIRGVIAGDP